MQFSMVKKVKDLDSLTELLKGLVGTRITMEKYLDYIIFQYEYDNIEEIINLFESAAIGLMDNFTAYTQTLVERYNDELFIAKELLPLLPGGSYNLKSALMSINTINNKKTIINILLKNTGINEDFIKGFARCDLNVSKASKELYVHRNTMNYKLERFYSLTGLDLRNFYDMYILIKLIEER